MQHRTSDPAHTPGTEAMGHRLTTEILEFIEAGVDSDLPESVFNAYALEIFAHHYACNALFRDYCDARNVRPGDVDRWDDIPVVWSDAFKTHLVASFPPEKAVMGTLTGGTTSLSQRGRIFRDEDGKRLVFTANRVLTGAYLFPDFEEGTRCRILILAPSPEVAPSMGMAVGMEQTRQHFGTTDSMFLLRKSGVDVKALIRALRESEAGGVPVALVGATSAYVYFFKACERRGMTFDLPPGSRVCDGGGYRGRFGPMTREGYYTLVHDILGIPETHCVNVLGEAETASNYFDDTLRRTVRGQPPRERIKPAPPWGRVRAVSVEDLKPLPDGEAGIIQLFDLANVPTVFGIMSDDLGYTKFGGCEMLGRAMVEDGRVATRPDERPVGAMGDSAVFRLLETYANFTIDFKMIGTNAQTGPVPNPDAEEAGPTIREEVEHAGPEAVASCPQVVDEMIMAGAEPEAAQMTDEALKAFRDQEERPLSEWQREWESQTPPKPDADDAPSAPKEGRPERGESEKDSPA